VSLTTVGKIPVFPPLVAIQIIYFFPKVTTILSITFVIISTITLVVSTLKFSKLKITPITNTTANHQSQTEQRTPDHPAFEIIELICVLWFTLEYTLRLWSSPHRVRSYKSPLNAIDFISIFPFYVSLVLDSLFPIDQEITSAGKIFLLFRILRIFRIFKLARHSQSMKAFGHTITKSKNEFSMFFFFVSIEILLFSSLIYFAEKDVADTQFTSIPASFWLVLFRF